MSSVEVAAMLKQRLFCTLNTNSNSRQSLSHSLMRFFFISLLVCGQNSTQSIPQKWYLAGKTVLHSTNATMFGVKFFAVFFSLRSCSIL